MAIRAKGSLQGLGKSLSPRVGVQRKSTGGGLGSGNEVPEAEAILLMSA